VKNIRPRRTRRNSFPLEAPALFAWADEHDRRSYPRHVRTLAARFGLTLPMAATVCELAGIGRDFAQ